MAKTSKQRLEDIFKRIDKLNTQGIKVELQLITDLDNEGILFMIIATDRLGNILEQEEINDVPREYIERYSDKYNVNVELNTYKIINGVKTISKVD